MCLEGHFADIGPHLPDHWSNRLSSSCIVGVVIKATSFFFFFFLNVLHTVSLYVYFSWPVALSFLLHREQHLYGCLVGPAIMELGCVDSLLFYRFRF